MKEDAIQLGMTAHHGRRYYGYWAARDGHWHLVDTEIPFDRTYTTRDACVRALRQLCTLNNITPITKAEHERS